MVLQVESNPGWLNEGDYVVFLTGEKSVNTYPKVMRMGKVIKGYNQGFEVEELSTGKIWKPYSQDTIVVNTGVPVKGVSAQLVFIDKL